MDIGTGYLAGQGVNLLGGFASGLFADDTRKRRMNQMFQMLQRRMGKPLISDQQVSGMIPGMQKSLAPQLNRIAQNASQRVGLDSGTARGAIANTNAGLLYELLNKAKMNQMNVNAQGEMDIMRMLTGLSGGF